MALQRTKIAAAGGPGNNMVNVGTSDTTVVDNPASTKTLVTALALHNYHASTIISVEVFIPSPSGGAPGASASSNRFAKVEGLPPGETAIVPFGEPGLMLTDDGDSIVCKCDTASACTAIPYGDTIT
jgi:hypothetical protein